MNFSRARPDPGKAGLPIRSGKPLLNLAPVVHQTKRTKRRKSRPQGKGAAERTTHTVRPDFELGPEDSAEYEAAGPHAYDKADWHAEGDFPDDLPEDQATVHTGMFVGW